MKTKLSLSFETLEKKIALSISPVDIGISRLFNEKYKDKYIDRVEMIHLLQESRDDNKVTEIELKDLKDIVKNSVMPNYVRVLASDIVFGNLANNKYRGQPLGDLQVNSPADKMTKLIDKWFYGGDLPNTEYKGKVYPYAEFKGNLFVNGPSYSDVRQGGLGDCGMIAAFGALAFSSPEAIKNMFIDNKDNTWTVRFSSQQTGLKDFVTVNRFLPVKTNGNVRFASSPLPNGGWMRASNPQNELWVALAEKATVQWGEVRTSNIIGYFQRDYINAYYIVRGFSQDTTMYNVLGYGYPVGVNPHKEYYKVTATNEVYMQNLVKDKIACCFSYNGHCYSLVKYESNTKIFTFWNPWGTKHLEVTWSKFVEMKPNKVLHVVDAKFTSPIKL